MATGTRWPLALLVAAVTTPVSASAQTTNPRYELDPITDTIVLTVSLVSSLGSELTIQSGELQADMPGPIANIPAYDRWVAERGERESGDMLSNIGVGLAIGYGVFDSIRAGIGQGGEHGWTTAVMYLESALVNWTVVNLVKLTVRRPRPSAYTKGVDPAETSRELSFYSGHAAMTAGMAGTAAYMLFAREGPSAPAWSVLVLGTALTAFVGINRVRANAHFPSDVVVGSMIGASIGVLVPHFHRSEDKDQQLREAVAPQRLLGGTFRFRF